MHEPEWVNVAVATHIHLEQIAEHGGLSGVRDHGALMSALSRPINLLAYGRPDLADLAGAYAFGLARNHAFNDGNKRTSFVVTLTFLLVNGFRVVATDDEKIATWLLLADGSLSEAEIGEWLRQRMRPA